MYTNAGENGTPDNCLRRIILFLVIFITETLCFNQLDHFVVPGKPLLHIIRAAFCATFALAIIHIWLWVWARSGAFLGMVMFSLICIAIGYALAAFVILAINSIVAFGAGFQLRFVATAALVMA